MDYTSKINEVKQFLEEVLDPKRFAHTMRVGECARDLADTYHTDKVKAYLAGIIHDLAKKREKELLKTYDISDLISAKDQETYFPIIHSHLAYKEAQDRFAIKDKDILNSILYHTTGRLGMTDLEKIVFIADAIEPGRGKGVEEIRTLAFKDLDKALVMVMDLPIGSCLKKKTPIYPLTIEARNYYLKGVDFE